MCTEKIDMQDEKPADDGDLRATASGRLLYCNLLELCSEVKSLTKSPPASTEPGIKGSALQMLLMIETRARARPRLFSLLASLPQLSKQGVAESNRYHSPRPSRNFTIQSHSKLP